VVIVTDGAIDDAGALPGDLLGAARVVVVPRSAGRDVGVATVEVPPSLRAGDTAVAAVDLIAEGVGPADTVVLELREGSRAAARVRVPLGAGGVVRREVPFVAAPVGGEREVRRYEVRVAGLAGDTEPRDDARSSVAAVTRASAIVLLSDSPDWDFRWLGRALAATSGVPVRGYVHLGPGGWREARGLRPVAEAEVTRDVARAALVVAHGGAGASALARLARRAVWRWETAGGTTGDWYVAAPEFASPVGGVLAGVPVESLPPLERAGELDEDSVAWTALAAQLERRGRLRPVMQGTVSGAQRGVRVGATGLWRWAAKGGVAGEAYRAMIAALTDWLLEDTSGERTGLARVRDSLAREGREFLPRPAVLAPQSGRASIARAEPVPLRHTPWPYAIALLALVAEWVARRRQGLR
jgi:hypothetical protein